MQDKDNKAGGLWYRRWFKSVQREKQSHAIITRLIGYAGHNMKCKLNLRMGATDCTCDCWAAIAEAQEFLEGESDE